MYAQIIIRTKQMVTNFMLSSPYSIFSIEPNNPYGVREPTIFIILVTQKKTFREMDIQNIYVNLYTVFTYQATKMTQVWRQAGRGVQFVTTGQYYETHKFLL